MRTSIQFAFGSICNRLMINANTANYNKSTKLYAYFLAVARIYRKHHFYGFCGF